MKIIEITNNDLTLNIPIQTGVTNKELYIRHLKEYRKEKIKKLNEKLSKR